MTEVFIPNPFGEGEIDERPIHEIIYASKQGLVGFVSVSPGEHPDLLQLDTERNRSVSRADSEMEGTVEKTYSKEGMVTNPGINNPGSFFTPIPPVVKSLFGGPLSIIHNPQLLIGLVAVVLVSQTSEKDKYTFHSNTLPAQVIDNQELEDKFFGSS